MCQLRTKLKLKWVQWCKRVTEANFTQDELAQAFEPAPGDAPLQTAAKSVAPPGANELVLLAEQGGQPLTQNNAAQQAPTTTAALTSEIPTPPGAAQNLEAPPNPPSVALPGPIPPSAALPGPAAAKGNQPSLAEALSGVQVQSTAISSPAQQPRAAGVLVPGATSLQASESPLRSSPRSTNTPRGTPKRSFAGMASSQKRKGPGRPSVGGSNTEDTSDADQDDNNGGNVQNTVNLPLGNTLDAADDGDGDNMVDKASDGEGKDEEPSADLFDEEEEKEKETDLRVAFLPGGPKVAVPVFPAPALLEAKHDIVILSLNTMPWRKDFLEGLANKFLLG